MASEFTRLNMPEKWVTLYSVIPSRMRRFSSPFEPLTFKSADKSSVDEMPGNC